MKKRTTTIIAVLMILIIGAVIFMPHVAGAQEKGSVAGKIASALVPTSVQESMVNSAIASIANFFLGVTSWFLTITGVYLSLSINITMHVKDFYTSATGVQAVWITIRDLSSMVIIFALLYYAILTIVGKGGGRWNKLIVNIFLAGILINFSLFFARVAIDASNLVSLQFYNAIAPSTDKNLSVSEVYKKGGISDVFMSNLKIPKIYQNTSVLKSVDVAAAIGFAAIGGIIIMISAGLSFLAAAIAFTARTGILLFCMALSPLYFVGMIFPSIKAKVSDPLFGLFKSQLYFMPIYLFLMYVALKLISDPKFTSVFNPGSTAGTEGPWSSPTIGVILQYTIAIIFINAPLMAAISFGGKGMKWAPGNLGLDLSKSLGKWTGRNTVGRAASKIAENESVKNLAARGGRVGQLALTGVRTAASDYNLKLDKQVSRKVKFGESLGHDTGAMNAAQAQLRNLNTQLAQAQANNQPTTNLRAQIRNARVAITDIENRRKATFASRVNTVSVDTLYLYRARKNKVAAAKLQIPIIQDQIDHHKEDLKTTRADLKQLAQAIRNNPAGTGTVSMPAVGPGALATPAQQAQYNDLLGDQTRQVNDVNTQEALLDNLKLIT